jgi:exodeoxyribonuclease VII large subunit
MIAARAASLSFMAVRQRGALFQFVQARRGAAMALLPRLSPAPLSAHLREQRAHLNGLSARLNGASYESVLARGFALVRDSAGHPITAAAAIRPKASLIIRFADGEAAVTAGGRDSARQGALPL